VVIDISHGEGESAVYFSTGSDDFEKNSGIAYYDFENKKWIPKGLKENIEFYSSDYTIATGSMLSVIPSTFWGNFPNLENVPISKDNVRHIGKPNSFSGFPMSNKFDANKNNLIKLKNLIKGPFLVEKIELEINGTIAAYPAYTERLNQQTVQDLKFINVSGNNRLGRTLKIYYESGVNVIPIVFFELIDENYVITVRFRSGITTAQQIKESIENFQPDLNSIVKIELIGTENNPQVVEEIYEFVPED
jgi:hypothetical protein